MVDLVLLSLLVGYHDFFSSIIGQVNGTAWPINEILLGQLPPVHKSQHEAISQYTSKLLHQVQGERRPARSQCVQKPHLRIKPNALRGGHTIIKKEGIQE